MAVTDPSHSPPRGRASAYDVTGGSAELPAAAGCSHHLAVFMTCLFFPCSSCAPLGHESPQGGGGRGGVTGTPREIKSGGGCGVISVELSS